MTSMPMPRLLALALAAVALIGCAGAEISAAPTATRATPAATPVISLGDTEQHRDLTVDDARTISGQVDGDLTVAQILGALAQLLERDEAELRAATLPVVRDLLQEGFLQPQS